MTRLVGMLLRRSEEASRVRLRQLRQSWSTSPVLSAILGFSIPTVSCFDRGYDVQEHIVSYAGLVVRCIWRVVNLSFLFLLSLALTGCSAYINGFRTQDRGSSNSVILHLGFTAL